MTTDEFRYATAIGFGDLIFIRHEFNDSGLLCAYAHSEVARESAAIGHAVLSELDAENQRPDIFPDWKELMAPVLQRTGTTSERRFVAGSTFAGIERSGSKVTVRPCKPDGRPGYSPPPEGPEYVLDTPTPQELGEWILRALSDSANFPGRPNVR